MTQSASRNAQFWQERGARAFRAGVEYVAFGTPGSWQRRKFQEGYRAERDLWRAQCGPDTLCRGPYNLLAQGA